MVELSTTSRGYTYIHDCKLPCKAIDTHHIIVRKSNRKRLMDISITILLWSFLLVAILVKFLFLMPVAKESVIVMPAFGVQLETHYMSGRIDRRFIPIGKILKPVLLECVTPVTCYWSLSLILHGETELTLVFKSRNYDLLSRCWYLSGRHCVVPLAAKKTWAHLQKMANAYK
ncbi:uncharacterized protein LOC8260903 isoform X3 [Ricinus communis]|uniref:uncharacterized protein LOC8260903 isoform X3 n=1 Tax=Ricinus communis TaxID=3988 RepID=UPI00201AD581|nr:uncharacterized protein LOC8260903 isoform X3 [Ricinus communis]